MVRAHTAWPAVTGTFWHPDEPSTVKLTVPSETVAALDVTLAISWSGTPYAIEPPVTSEPPDVSTATAVAVLAPATRT